MLTDYLDMYKLWIIGQFLGNNLCIYEIILTKLADEWTINIMAVILDQLIRGDIFKYMHNMRVSLCDTLKPIYWSNWG